MSVYVARIPPECDEKELKEIFEGVGPVKSVSLKSSKGDHKTNYAFIDFTNDDDANCAVQFLNNYKLGDYKLLVNVKKKESSASASEPSNSGGVGGFKSAGQRFPFKSSGTQGKGSFGNYGFTGIKSTGGSIEYGDSNSQFKYGGTSLSMSENGWDEESDSGSKNSGPIVSEVKEIPSEEKVLVIHVEHPGKFWGQPVSKENAKELDFIASELAKECKIAKKINNNVVPKKVYGSKFSLDQQWYRCMVEKHLSEKDTPKVKVRYIDYGNCEIVEASSLVELPVSLQQQPPCAREYKLGIDPVNSNENSDQFKQGVEFLQSLLDNEVVNVITSNANPSVKVTVVSSNKNVENEMNAAGYTVSIPMQKKEKSDIDTLSKPLQPLRSPRNIASPPVNGMLGQQSSKEMEDLKAKFASAQSQLQSSELLAEKLKAENQLLKQNNSTYEESLAKANSRINDISSWIVSTKFMKLMDDVSSLKELRGEMSVALKCNPVLKDVVASLTENENSISLKNLSSFAQLLDAESTLSTYQENIRSCSNKEEIASLVCKRDGSRKDFIEKSNDFLDDVKRLNFESREKELEILLTRIEENYHTASSFQSCSGSISEAIEAYENWRGIKSESLKKSQENVDIWSSLLTNTLESFKQNLSIKEEMTDNVMECQNIDDVIEKYWNAVTDEIKSIKETNIDEECRNMVSDIISSIVHSIRQERDDIATLRDKSVEYERKKSEFEAWITRKPDMVKLKETRAQLKTLKSKFRHKQADRRDLEEDSEEDESLKKIEGELKVMRNEMHELFTEESELLGQLSRIAEIHFPEFSTLHPEFGISAYLESNGILHARELEYYDHHFLPLISSATSQPLVFKAQFNQEDCVLKEYSLCSQLSKEIFKSRVFNFAKCKHPNVITLESLFFDKAGRKAYLQTPFYGNGNFKDFLETRPDSKDLVGVFYALLQAVEALHVSGCVHGGIAPSKVSIKKSKSELIAILREPNFSSDEKKQLEDLANIYPIMKWNWEGLSKELDMLCFGLLMFSAYFPDQKFNTDVILDTKEKSIYHVIKGLLCENASERMTASDAINHPIFQVELENTNSLSGDLLKTDTDPSDSFAIVELNESTECTELNDALLDDDGIEKKIDRQEMEPLWKTDQSEVGAVDNTEWLAEE